METVYSSIKRMKRDATRYLKKGYFTRALETYRKLGERGKAARLMACLERTGGKEREACKKYLRGRFIRQQAWQLPLLTSVITLEGIGLAVGSDAYFKRLDEHNQRFEPRMELAEKYTEQIPPEKELPSPAKFGGIVGGLLGLYVALGNYSDEKRNLENQSE